MGWLGCADHRAAIADVSCEHYEGVDLGFELAADAEHHSHGCARRVSCAHQLCLGRIWLNDLSLRGCSQVVCCTRARTRSSPRSSQFLAERSDGRWTNGLWCCLCILTWSIRSGWPPIAGSNLRIINCGVGSCCCHDDDAASSCPRGAEAPSTTCTTAAWIDVESAPTILLGGRSNDRRDDICRLQQWELRVTWLSGHGWPYSGKELDSSPSRSHNFLALVACAKPHGGGLHFSVD